MFRFRYRYLCVAFLSLYSYLNIRYTVGERLFDFPIPQPYLLLVLTLVVLGIWELNRLSENFIERLTLRRILRIHRLITGFILSLLHVVIVSAISMQILYLMLGISPHFDFSHQKLLLAFGFRVNLFLQCINAIVFYMNKLKQTQLEAEQFKHNLIEAQFETLRNQINPHFLFNCFNVLSSLVYKDADTASLFIAQLSRVYRYLLYNQEKRLVQLLDELAFIESYLYLLKIRFGDNLEIINTINDRHRPWYIAPAVLQMLIENAIKHNVISKKFPLRITLSEEGGFIVVSNNLQEKAVKEDSLRIGLNNITRRYRFLSTKPVEVLRSDSSFTVRIPLLEVQQL